MMKKADIIYNEDNLLRILDGLEARGNWRQALAVIEWVYNENSYRHRKSRLILPLFFSLCAFLPLSSIFDKNDPIINRNFPT